MKIEALDRAQELYKEIKTKELRIATMKEFVEYLETVDYDSDFLVRMKVEIFGDPGTYLPAYFANICANQPYINTGDKPTDGVSSKLWVAIGDSKHEPNHLSLALLNAHIEVYRNEIKHQQNLMDDMLAEIDSI